MQPKFSRSLKRNMELMHNLLKLDETDDIVTREFTALGRECVLYFVEGMCNGQQIGEGRPKAADALPRGCDRPGSARACHKPPD